MISKPCLVKLGKIALLSLASSLYMIKFFGKCSKIKNPDFEHLQNRDSYYSVFVMIILPFLLPINILGIGLFDFIIFLSILSFSDN